jgi:hypothetical protein
MRLQPGDRILVQPGRIETVVAPSERDEYGGVLIHTHESDITTSYPCAVKVVNR